MNEAFIANLTAFGTYYTKMYLVFGTYAVTSVFPTGLQTSLSQGLSLMYDILLALTMVLSTQRHPLICLSIWQVYTVCIQC